ncbi:hypothetical protein [Bradyrhizobium oligotrophicum]|uniref:hypothetical protein n=1 Tax=Bradyrhizobium oligotrophicum TaxID=44255 RepID=UPI003EB77B13
MPQLLKLLGFWPPVVYGFAVFMLFWFLDKQAAPRARKSISEWFAGPQYQRKDVADAVLYVFDLLYTRPLLGWTAFWRSALISAIVTTLVSIQVYPNVPKFAIYAEFLRWSMFTQCLTNIAADYLSLFFVRRWLILGGDRPILALATAPIIGVLIVIACYFVRDVGGFSLQTGTFHLRYFAEDLSAWYEFLQNRGLRFALLVPALVVHLWLPLFALGVVFAKVVNSVRTAGRLSQWFFAQGEAHPLRSVGYVAAAATVILVAIGMVVFRR